MAKTSTNVRYSSVAKGGSSPPIGLKSMQNSVFLAVLRLIFGLKTKIIPPKEIGVRIGEEAEMSWSRRSGSHSPHEDVFFLEITYF